MIAIKLLSRDPECALQLVVIAVPTVDVIVEADWSIGLGPEGRKVVAACTPKELVRKKTHTGWR